jgi:hypothetical protein
MSFEAFDAQTSEPDLKDHYVKFVGGTTAVTKLFGKGMSVSYISTGVVDLIWKENPGAFMGVKGYCFEATVQGGVKGYTVVAGVFNTSTFTLRLNIFGFGATPALTDLAALQWLSITLGFKFGAIAGNAAT